MQVLNVGVFLAHNFLDPNTDSETKSEKKAKQSLPTQAKPPALSVVLTQTMLELLSELQRENVHRKCECQRKTRVITGRLIGFPKKEKNKTPSSWTLHWVHNWRAQELFFK